MDVPILWQDITMEADVNKLTEAELIAIFNSNNLSRWLRGIVNSHGIAVTIAVRLYVTELKKLGPDSPAFKIPNRQLLIHQPKIGLAKLCPCMFFIDADNVFCQLLELPNILQSCIERIDCMDVYVIVIVSQQTICTKLQTLLT